MRQRKSTMIELVEELRKLPKSKEIDFMIKEALAGEYHDYKNVKYCCGKIESYSRLRKLGHVDLAEKIKNGEFDEIADEDDKNMMRNDLKDNMTLKQANEMNKLLGL